MSLLRINESIWNRLLFNNRNDPKRLLFIHRIIILILTFIVYMTYHMSRKPMSVVKSKLYHKIDHDHDDHNNNTILNNNNTINIINNDNNSTNNNWEPFNSDAILSLMDGLYWGSYAICMFLTGYIAERSNFRLFLTLTLSLCGILCIIFGLSKPFNIHSFWFFIIMQILLGAMQTSGWPTVVAIVGSWFSNRKKGLIFGIWNSHTSVGNILGLLIAGAFVDFNWGLSFIVPGLICLLVALMSFLLIIPVPGDIGLDLDVIEPPEEKPEENNVTRRQSSVNEDKAITLLGALKIPGVIEFSLCLAFAKSVSYIFLNWLPKYLDEKNHLSSSKSAFTSIIFDIGGMVGSIIAGLLADKSDASGLVCIVFLILAVPSLFLFQAYSQGAIGLILQFISGFFINGPYALITTAVSANLACKVPSHSAMATVSAIIDGTGSIGAAIGPAITGPMAEHFGWGFIFYLCMIADLIAILCLARVGYGEFRKIFQNR